VGQVGSGAWSEESSRGANPRRAATALARETDRRANGLDGGIKASKQVELTGDERSRCVGPGRPGSAEANGRKVVHEPRGKGAHSRRGNQATAERDLARGGATREWGKPAVNGARITLAKVGD